MFLRRRDLSPSCVEFDTTGWIEVDKDQRRDIWANPNGDLMMVEVYNRPQNLPFSLHNDNEVLSFYQAESERNGGVPVSTTLHDGFGMKYIKGIYKYRHAENKLAMYYVGILVFHFKKFSFQINTESWERGTTGIREAVTFLSAGKFSEPTGEPKEIKNIDELFDDIAGKPVINVPSDDEKYDEAFPDHPLSVVRRLQQTILDTLVFTDWLKKEKPMRKSDVKL